MKGQSSRNRAFTLVEILMVLLLIGILAGAMMLVSFSATAKAEATRIVEDMRSMKCAAVFFHADHGRWPLWMTRPDGTYFEGSEGSLPNKYLERLPKGGNYWIGVASTSKDEVAVMLDATLLDNLVKQRLESMTKEIPLKGSNSKGNFTVTPFKSTDSFALWYIRNP